MTNGKPILCLDFDGVLHSYVSGWQGADVIADPPVKGAMQFIEDAVHHFDVQIFSSRSNQAGGITAMQDWLHDQLIEFSSEHNNPPDFPVEWAVDIFEQIKWPTEKPPAMVTIDDRAITFTGEWPSIDELRAFKPWTRQ